MATQHREPRDSTPLHLPEERIAWIRGQQAGLNRYLLLLGARPDEAEDLVQDAFVALFSHYAEEQNTSQARLLRTIARNKFLASRRQRKHQLTAWSEAVDTWLADHPGALENELAGLLGICMEELSTRARLALSLHHVDSRSVDEVAGQLGIQPSGAQTLLQRGRDLLRTCLARRGFHGWSKDQAPQRESQPSGISP